MKKRTVFLSVFLALDIILLAVSGWMFFQASQAGVQPEGFHAIITNAEEYVSVGQMRLSKAVDRNSLFGSCMEPKEVQVRDYVPAGKTYNGQALKEGHSLLAVWIKDPTGGSNGDFNHTLYRYCEEDGFWYEVYSTHFAYRGFGTGGGEWDEYCEIPSDVLEDPGKYIIQIESMAGTVGGCTFELPLSQPEARGGGAQ